MTEITLNDLAVRYDGEEIEQVKRLSVNLKGLECVIYHCRFYPLKGYAPWERYIDLREVIEFSEIEKAAIN